MWVLATLIATAVALTTIGAAELPVLHEAQLSVFMSTLPNINSTVGTADLSAVDSGAAAAQIVLFPTGITSANLVTVPVGTVSVCVAYSLASNVSGTPSVSLSTLGAMLLGNASGLSVTNSARRQPMLDASSVNIVLANVSGSNAVVLSALRDAAVGGFVGITSFPSAVYANPRVRFVADDAAVASEIAMGGNTFGLLTLLYATSQRLPCAKITEFDAVNYVDQFLTPRLPAADAPQYYVNMTGLTSKPISNLHYPITGVAAVVVGRTVACSGSSTGTDLIHLFLLSDTFRAAMLQWGVLPLRSTAAMRAFTLMKDQLCLPETRVTMGGSSALYPVMSDLSVLYQDKSTTTFIEYVSTSSGDGIAGVESGAYLIGGSDVSNTASGRALNPTVVYLPTVSFGVTLVYSFPEQMQLVIPKCAVVPIFNGSMTHWDDAVLRAANLGASLPHEPIRILASGTSSGITQAFMEGLDRLDRACNGGASTIVVSSVYNLLFSTVSTYASSDAQIDALRDTPWSLGYLAIAHGRPSGLPEATLTDESTGARTAPETAAIQTTLATAVVDANTLAVSLKLPSGGWPFVGVSNLVFDMDHMGNCTAFSEAVQFVYRMLNDAEVRTRLDDNYVMAMSETVSQLSTSYLKEAKCDGQYVYPRSSASSEMSVVVIIVLAVSGALVVGGLCALLYYCTRHTARDIRFAPKDASSPFAVAFTDIQASTALWAQMPEVMAPALDTHHEIIRGLIAKHEAYEVKTIGDAFMIVSSSLESLVRIALEIQDEFQAHEWGTDLIDELYRQQAEDMREDVPHVPAALPDDEYASLWNGLRVRVGVHYGFGDVRLDQVSKGYDYYGSVVNTAARTESIAHGGQVLLSSAALEALHSTGSGKQLFSSLTVVDLGPQVLKGLDAPVSVQQVSRGTFVGRRFPPLRLERAAEVTDLTDEGSSATDGPTTTASSLHSDNTPNDAISVLVSAVEKNDRNKVLAVLCTSWRVPFDRSQTSAAISILAKRVSAIMNQKRRTSERSKSRENSRSHESEGRSRKGMRSRSSSHLPIEFLDHSQTSGSVGDIFVAAA